jgi:molecular chaperone HscB
MDFDFAQDHFTLFGLERRYAIDADELDRRYLRVQSEIHPDKHAHLGETERRLSMQWATRANEAYQTLKHPVKRARYLLELVGVDPQVEHNTAMPHDFLVEQMEWREAVDEAQSAGDSHELEHLHNRLRREMTGQYAALGESIDGSREYGRAADLVRQLMFQEKLLAEIDAAIERLEA